MDDANKSSRSKLTSVVSGRPLTSHQSSKQLSSRLKNIKETYQKCDDKRSDSVRICKELNQQSQVSYLSKKS